MTDNEQITWLKRDGLEGETETLKMIAEDMEKDAKNFDGKPFNGRTVAEYFGNQGAAITALAEIILSILIKGDIKDGRETLAKIQDP